MVQVAFFTDNDENQGSNVLLFANNLDNPRAPSYGGHIGQTRASVFIRRPKRRKAFLSIVGQSEGTGLPATIATAKIRIVKGVPKMALCMTGSDKPIWVNISKSVTIKMLAEMGCSVMLIGRKKA